MNRLAIIDYGSGNLRSVGKACEHVIDEAQLDCKVQVTNQPDAVLQASHIILPGVGAFGDCVAGLNALPGMVDALSEAVLQQQRPFLGICVGMQMLADTGYEHGTHQGLGWISGEVIPIPPNPAYKIPHMGWNQLTVMRDHPCMDGIPSGAYAYFVHSYHFACDDPGDVLATVDYGGTLTAMLARDNMIATQFHPEKSQATGLRLINNFLKWKL